MAQVLSDRVARFDVERRRGEVTADDPTVDPRVRERFLAAGYGARHTPADLGCSYRRFAVARQDGADIVTGALAPYSFYLKLAYMEVREAAVAAGGPGAAPASPRLANVGLIWPVVHEGRPHLVTQVKGRALDRGQILAVAAAGKIDAPSLFDEDPLRATLAHELADEVGLRLDDLTISPFAYVVDEPETGNVNHSAVCERGDLATIAAAYERHTDARLAENRDPATLEVAALALVPLDGSAAPPQLEAIVTITRHPSGRTTMHRQSYSATYYTWAILAHLRRPGALGWLLETAGR